MGAPDAGHFRDSDFVDRAASAISRADRNLCVCNLYWIDRAPVRVAAEDAADNVATAVEIMAPAVFDLRLKKACRR